MGDVKVAEEMKLRAQVTCPACQGKRVIEDPTGHWKTVLAAMKAARAAYKAECKERGVVPAREDVVQAEVSVHDAYWSGHGYAQDRIGAFKNLPPEEADCEDCGGTGMVERWAPMSEVLRFGGKN